MTVAARNLLGTPDAAARYGRPARTFRDWARRGLVPAVRVGPRGHFMFDAEALDAFLAGGATPQSSRPEVDRRATSSVAPCSESRGAAATPLAPTDPKETHDERSPA